MVNLQACLTTSCLTLGWLLGVEGFAPFRTSDQGVRKPAEESKYSSVNNMQKQPTDISTCGQYISQGHCHFYTCLDDLLHCAGAKHQKILMQKFCNKAKHHSELFTSEGISWAHNTNKCVMKKLIQTYNQLNQKVTWCSHVDTLANEAFVQCAATKGVCKTLGTDRTALAKVFTVGSWMTLVEAARNCPPAQVNQFIFWNLDHMHFHR